MVDLTYINAALTRIGESQISSLAGTEGIGAQIADANYEIVVSDELGGYPWRWASRTVDLGSATLTGDTEKPWTYTRTLPLPALRVRTVMVEGQPIRFERRYDQILSMYDGDYTLIAHGTFRPDELYWEPQFGELITLRMQQVFLRAIGERYQEADALNEAIERQRARARTTDAQGAPPRDPWVSPLLVARRA